MTVLLTSLVASFLIAVAIGVLFWFALGSDEGSY
jgi:hypothetical protein